MSHRTAYSRAVDLLARRDRSASELWALLCRAGFAEAEVRAALGRVSELGYLNEQRLAEALIREARLAGRGPRAASLKLKKRGIEGWTLERVQALWSESAEGMDSGQSAHEQELEVARAFLRRRFGDALDQADHKLMQRAMGALLRRGFSFDVARGACIQPPRQPAPRRLL